MTEAREQAFDRALGQRIRELRRTELFRARAMGEPTAPWTQEGLGARFNTSGSNWGKMERGEVSFKPSWIPVLAERIFWVPVSRIWSAMDGVEEMSPREPAPELSLADLLEADIERRSGPARGE